MNKRFFLLILTVIILTSTTSTVFSQQKLDFILEKISIKQNDKTREMEAISYNNSIYVPLANIIEIIGGEINTEESLLEVRDYVDFQEADPLKGEIFIYGTIEKIEYDTRTILINQHMDDNSIEIFPKINIKNDVIIIAERRNKRMNIDFEDLKVGDSVGLVLDKDSFVRGIILEI